MSSEYLNSFLEMLTVERDAPLNTISSYRQDLKNFMSFVQQNNLSLATVTLSHLEEYRNNMIAQKLSTTSVLRKISALRQFFNFIVQEEVRLDNPVLRLSVPKKPQRLPNCLTEDQISTLIRTAHQDTSKEGLRNLTMLEILYASGMRISELVTIRLSSLQHNGGTNVAPQLLIKGKGSKERLVFLTPPALNCLNCYLAIRPQLIPFKFRDELIKSDWLFPSLSKTGKLSHISRQRFAQILKEIAITAGIVPQLVSPHRIRHSFASLMLKNGANLRVIQELLGHADISSTQIYTKVFDEQLYDTVLNKHPLSSSQL